jgi:hypothetical protein
MQIIHHGGLKKERKSAFKFLVIVHKSKHVTTTDICLSSSRQYSANSTYKTPIEAQFASLV